MWLVGSKPIKSNVMQRHLFRTFCVIANLWRSESTGVFCTHDVMCHVLWHHLSSLCYQFSIFEDGWQPCRSHRRGSKHKELAAPLTQFMSSKAASSSSSDKPGPLMSCGLDSSPSMHDASVETPSSSASLKETLVSSYMAKEETLKA